MPYVFWIAIGFVTIAMLLELPHKTGGWPHWDKVQHLLLFVVLTTLAFLAYPKWHWSMVVLLVIYGGLVEWMQAVFTVTRMASLGDWLADIVGILVTVMVFQSIALQRQFKAPK